jgi:glycosyltransferase involved in cell wall biosynthesis
MNRSSQPLVSIVTPFYNTADYLRACIESVLSQTYSNFEYLLVDNQSTDGSASIAAEYAARDARIRVIRNEKFVGQVPNYNGALLQVSPAAQYVKMVQADDCIFPECVERMVAIGEANPTAAIVSSYYLTGSHICGGGVDWPTECIPGRTASRMHLLNGTFLFGTPTTLMYRGDLVRSRRPFYSETSLHEDTELCHEVMADSDLGFVHQVLSFNRVGNSGILTSVESFNWQLLDFYITLQKCGRYSLSGEELSNRLKAVRAEYRRLLGESALLGRSGDFWAYHEKGLKTVGETLPSRFSLVPELGRAVLKALVHPKWFFDERVRLKGKTRGQRKRSPTSRQESYETH